MSKKTIALYMRLSREDGDRAESESIENQRRLLYGFIRKKCPEWNCAEYIDEGYSGTTFERPGFLRMISDINMGIIGGVVVKDLSRLGREYIQTGYYIENYFPSRGIRFISINDGIDSQEDLEGGDNRGLLISFKNLINDEYARDISIKVKSALRAKKENGIYACAFCRYGYRKNEEGEVEIFPDEAKIVQSIFRWYMGGAKQRTIATYLNQLAVLPPALSKGLYSGYTNKNVKGNSWNYQSVHRILSSTCYMGRAVLSKTHTISHKIKKTVKTQLEKQIICTVPAIINEEEFFAVQKKIKRAGQKNIEKKKSNHLSGLLYCATCGAKMYPKKGSQKEYFVCATYKNAGKNACTSHYIDKLKLEKAVDFLLGNIKLSPETINDAKKCYAEQNTSYDATTFKNNQDVNFLTNKEKVNTEGCKPANVALEDMKFTLKSENVQPSKKFFEDSKNHEIPFCLAGFSLKSDQNDDVTNIGWTFVSKKECKQEQNLFKIKKIEIISHGEIILHLKM
jgi:DNA invertase Pin-like site-specific DNA recombinase